MKIYKKSITTGQIKSIEVICNPQQTQILARDLAKKVSYMNGYLSTSEVLSEWLDRQKIGTSFSLWWVELG